MYIRCTFADSNILWSKIYKSYECSGALVEALTKYDGKFKFESLETNYICRRVNICDIDPWCRRIRGAGELEFECGLDQRGQSQEAK